MRKAIPMLFTRLVYFAIISACFSVFSAHAQDFTIGTGATGNTATGTTTAYPCPLQDLNEGSRAQYLYKASELQAAGMSAGAITAFKFEVIVLGDAATMENVQFKIGHTAASSLASGSWDAFAGATVATYVANYTPIPGINVVTLPLPFYWDGTQNVMLEICNGDDNSSLFTLSSNPVIPWTSGLAFNGSHTYRGANVNGCGFGTTTNTGLQTNRPNIIFTWLAAAACAGKPAAGTAASSSSQVCGNQPFQLSLTGATTASQVSYQWQSSANNTTWADVPGKTALIVSLTQMAPTNYRAVVTCTNAGQKDTSNAVFVNIPSLVAGNFTIDNSVPASTPTIFKTFTEAVNSLKCGISGPVTFNVVKNPASYEEQVSIPVIPGASATNSITFNGNGAVLKYKSTSTASRHVIQLNGADHIIIDSLNIDCSEGDYGWGIWFTNAADSNIIRKCSIIASKIVTTSSYHSPIAMSASNTSTTSAGNNANYNLLQGNILIGGYYAVSMYGSSTDGSENIGNRVLNNTLQDSYSYLIYSYGQKGAVISGNDMSRLTRTTTTTIAGVFVSGHSKGILLEKNIIHGLFGSISNSTSSCYPIYVSSNDASSTEPVKIINNLVYDIKSNGIIYGIYNSSSDYMLAYHNTLVLNDNQTTTGAVTGIYQAGAATGLDLRNNIIYITRSGTGAKRCLHFNTTTSDIISSNNVLYLNAPAGTDNLVGQYGSAFYSTLSDWKTANANAYDQNSVDADPLFESPGTGNFTPTEPNVNNIGTPLGVSTDITGKTRGALPDPGAFEFSLPGCSNPPAAGTPVVSDPQICVGTLFSLNLENNSVGAGQAYQWQSSPDSSNWTNVGPSTTTPLFATSIATETYFRCIVTCAAGTPVASPGLHVTVANVFGAFTINSTLTTGGTNFQSFADAISYLRCGITGPVVFNVEPFTGPYTESISITEIAGTSGSNTVTFNGNGNTLLYNTSSSNGRTAIVLNGADHVIFDSLVVDVRGGSYGWGIQFTNQADSNIIRKCTVIAEQVATNTNYAGILMSNTLTSLTATGSNGNGNLVEGNTVLGGYYGISLAGSTNDHNTGNIIRNNIVQDYYNGALYIQGQSGVIVSGNDISRPTRTNGGTYHINLNNCINGSLIEKNRIHNMFDAIASNSSSASSINITMCVGSPSQPNRLENNLVYNVNAKGNPQTTGVALITSDFWKIYHNSIVLDNPTVTSTQYTYGINASGEHVDVLNNLVYVNVGGTGSKYCLYYGSTGVAKSNQNVLFIVPVGANYGVGYYTTAFNDLAAWKTAKGGAYDQNSYSVDPLFAPGSFIPAAPIINNIAAANIGVSTDIVGKPRGATPDPGAFEFTVAACLNPVFSGTVNTSSNVCAEASFLLDLIGNSTGEGLSFQWQVSTNNTDWSDLDTPQASAILQTSQSVTSYYRCKVICSGGAAVITASAMVSCNPLAPAGVYTIDKNQPNNGSNFNSFTSAASFLECGIAGPVVFNVVANSGPYNEKVIFPEIMGTSAVNTVTVNGNGNTLAYSGATNGDRPAITLNGADHFIFDNLVIDVNGGMYGWCMLLTNQADSNIIRNCSLLSSLETTSSNFAGIVIAGSTSSPNTEGYNGNGNLIENNMFKGGYDAVSIRGASNEYLTGNDVVNNVMEDYYINGVNVAQVESCKISGNDLSRPTRLNAGNYSMSIGNNGGNMLIEKNKVHHLFTAVSPLPSAMYIFNIAGSGSQLKPNRLENNLIYGITRYEAVQRGINAPNMNYWNISHNTIVLDDRASTSGNTYGIFAYGDIGLNVNNNIVHIDRGGSSTESFCLYYGTIGVATSNNNVLYNVSPVANPSVGFYSGAYVSLADWKTANGGAWDQNSISVNPLFTNIAQGNGLPTAPAVAGIGNSSTGVLTDIVDKSRDANMPTPGAYEMAVGLPVTILNIDAVRAGADVKLSWATLTEINNNGFDIERSLDGSHFRGVGFVQTKASNGNSTANLIYEFLDLVAPTSDIYYRLKQQDNNGRAQLSNVVRIKALSSRRFDITSLFPNPVRGGDLNVMMTSQQTSKLTLLVTDVAGKTLLQQNETIAQGINTMKLSLSNLPAGTYFLRAICNDGCETTVRKFVIQ